MFVFMFMSSWEPQSTAAAWEEEIDVVGGVKRPGKQCAR